MHEDSNIKSDSNNQQAKEESDTIDTTDIELSNEYWANTIRNNASYIYGLFFGQLKSTLTCNECNTNKLKYENFSALELPIPEGGKINLEIILFRLPYTLSPFYNIDNTNSNNKNSIQEDKNISSIKNEKEGKNLRKMLKKIRSKSIGKYAIPTINSPLNSDREPLNIKMQSNNHSKFKDKNYNEAHLDTAFYENFNNVTKRNKKIEKKTGNEGSTTINREGLISNALNLNIPIKLHIEVERNQKCSKIIEILKGMKELELDTESKYTEFLLLSKNRYIKEDSIIDDTFLSYSQVYIYELLNYEGIKKIFGYEDISKCTALELKKQDVQGMIDIVEEEIETNNNLSFNSSKRRDSSSSSANSEIEDKSNVNPKKTETVLDMENHNTNEILIQVIHAYKNNPSSEREYSFNRVFSHRTYELINTFKDFIILTSNNSIKPVNLYEMIWEKYMYFLDSPTKYEPLLWWQTFSASCFSSSKNVNNNVNKNDVTNNFNISCVDNNTIPFKIKIIKKSTKACYFCPWFRLCSGCILNPAKQEYLSLSSEILILVDWKREIIRKDMRESNILFCLNHTTSNKSLDNSENDDDKKSIYDCLDLFTREETLKNILCEKCNKKTNFKKRLEIDKFPKYLTLILKRFKYTSMFTTKIDNLIHFPVESLDMTNYIAQKEGKIKYDLFGVVNHVGGLTGGHYHCDIKQDDTWIQYDDSYTCEYHKNIETPNAYLLVYKCNEKGSTYHDLMRQEYKLNLMGLMDTAYKIYLKQYNFEHIFNYIYDNTTTENSEITEEYMNDCEFYYGEPITVNGKSGYLINIYKRDDNEKVYIKIKLNKGYYETVISRKKIIKETVKIYNSETTDLSNSKQINEEINNDGTRTYCGGCNIY